MRRAVPVARSLSFSHSPLSRRYSCIPSLCSPIFSRTHLFATMSRVVPILPIKQKAWYSTSTIINDTTVENQLSQLLSHKDQLTSEHIKQALNIIWGPKEPGKTVTITENVRSLLFELLVAYNHWVVPVSKENFEQAGIYVPYTFPESPESESSGMIAFIATDKEGIASILKETPGAIGEELPGNIVFSGTLLQNVNAISFNGTQWLQQDSFHKLKQCAYWHFLKRASENLFLFEEQGSAYIESDKTKAEQIQSDVKRLTTETGPHATAFFLARINEDNTMQLIADTNSSSFLAFTSFNKVKDFYQQLPQEHKVYGIREAPASKIFEMLATAHYQGILWDSKVEDGRLVSRVKWSKKMGEMLNQFIREKEKKPSV